jgi:steroid delta-isomerase-like uncharacterized protein
MSAAMTVSRDDYQKYVDAWNRQDVITVASFHGNDCIYEDVAYGVKVEGLENVSRFVENVFKSIPDFSIEVVNFFAAEEFGVGEWIMSGTRKEGYFRERGTTVIEILDGKFVRNSDYHNLSLTGESV